MSKPKSVQNRTCNDLTYARVAVGLSHCLAIEEIQLSQLKGQVQADSSYQLVGWGSNENGCLGKKFKNQQKEDYNDGYHIDNESERVDTIYTEPIVIMLKYKNVSYVPLQVACGSKHSIVSAISSTDFRKLISEEHSLDKMLKSSKLSNSVVVFSAGVDLDGRLGQVQQQNEQENPQIDEPVVQQKQTVLDDYDEDEDDTDKLIFTQIVQQISHIIMISCGANFTIALNEFGQVYSWGEGSTGALGRQNKSDTFAPQKIDFQGDLLSQQSQLIKFIAAGTSHAAAISELGKLYTWGLGSCGQLGHGNLKSLNFPQEVGGQLSGKKLDFVACGGLHTCCVTSDGYAHSFGFNKNGQLGTGDFLDRSLPSKVNSISNYFVVYAQCGGNTTFVVTEERLIFSFGCNMYGRLAQQESYLINISNATLVEDKFFDNKGEFVYQLALSTHFGLALTENGQIISWGLPFKGCLARDIERERLQLQQPDGSALQESFNNMENDFDDEDMQDDNKISLQFEQMNGETLKQLTKPQRLQTNQNSYVGMDPLVWSSRLQKDTRASQYIAEVKCGTFHTVGLTDVGELWVWGSNQSKQHGITDEEVNEQFKNLSKCINFTAQKLLPETMPTQVPLFYIKENRRITYFETGFEFLIVVENRRSVYSWGKNNCGQLGLGFVSEQVTTPTKIVDLEGTLISQIACGEDHTLLLSDEGAIYSFGSPADGKLGLGQKQTLQLFPQKIESLSDVYKISCGPNHSLALVVDPLQGERVIPLQFLDEEKDLDQEEQNDDDKKKCVIYSWGSGSGGKLGHGNCENYYFPKMIQTKYTFKDISSGTNHSGAISTQNSLIVWGVATYLGLTKPDEDGEQKKKPKKNQVEEVQEPYSIKFPVLHTEHQNQQFNQLCLGDKYNMALNKQGKIMKWGIFNTDFQYLIKKDMMGKTEANRQQATEKIMCVYSTLDGQYTDLSCSFNHAAATTTVGMGQVTRKEAFLWGRDGMTGRLGLGYEFFNPEQQDEIDQNEIQQVKNKIEDLNKEFEQPESLSFINQYLENQYKIFLQQRNQERAQNDNDQNANDPEPNQNKELATAKRPSNTPPQGSMIGGLQIKKQSHKYHRNKDLVNIANNLGISSKKENTSISLEQFLTDSAPDIYKSTIDKKLFNEKLINDLYDKAIHLETAISVQYQTYKEVDLKKFKDFQDQAMLVTLKKIQAEPFKVSFLSVEKKGLSPQFTENKFPYKVLLTLLQLHPCYLLNIFKNKLMPELQFVNTVFDVFGDIQKDKRKYRLFTALALEILKYDLQKPKTKLEFDLQNEKQNVSFVFMHLFIGFQGQFQENITFNSKLQVYAEKAIDIKIYQNESIQKPLKDYGLIYRREQLGDYLSSKGSQDVQQIRKIFELQVDTVLKVMKEFTKEISTGFSTKILTFAKPVQEIIIKVYDLLKYVYLVKNISEETIHSRVLNLCFLSYFDQYIKSTEIKERNMKQTDDTEEHRLKNVNSFCSIFQYFLKQESIEFSPEQPWIIKINEFISSGSPERKKWFDSILAELKQSTVRNYKDNVKKIKDLYLHSLKNKDDVINPKVKTLLILTQIVNKEINQIIINKNPNDMIKIFNQQLHPEKNYLVKAPDPGTMEERIQVRLNSRQLFYAKKYSIKMCNFCKCFLLESFLGAEDKLFIERFEHWNPVSLPALFVRMIPTFKYSQDFDEFISGSKADVTDLFKRKCIEWKNENNYERIIQIKDFERSFADRVKFFLEQNDSIQIGQEKQFLMLENKKQIKELKRVVEEKLKYIHIYIFAMEQKMVILDKIQQKLERKTSKRDDKQLDHDIITTNCFFGLANKEIEKPLEHNTKAMCGKIRDAINDIPTSQEIYENIDVFKPNSDVLVKLGMFGNYQYLVLKKRNIIDRVDDKIFDQVRKILSSPNLTKKFIEECLVYTFQETHQNIIVYLLYQESKISIASIASCGYIKPLKEPVEMILDEFEIQNSLILLIRKGSILNQTATKLKRKFGKYTHFTEQRLLNLLDELQNHCCIYDHMNQEPNKKDTKKEPKIDQK